MATAAPPLAIFDLDHTLLDGDTDTLWCDYLIDQELLPASWRLDNQRLQTQYRQGAVAVQEFSDFYARTIAYLPAGQVMQVRADFTRQCCVPRIKPGAAALLAVHRERGDTLVLSSATSTFLCTPTGRELGFQHILGTELERSADGRFSGLTQGTPNMREGKVARLLLWLDAMQHRDATNALRTATFYSDSIHDLPLLQAVGHAVAIDPDPLLRKAAAQHQWPIRSLF